MEELLHFIATIAWRDLTPVLVPAITAMYVVHVTVLSTRIENRRKADAAHAKEVRDIAEREERAEAAEASAAAAGFTERFRALMDGYEARAEDLTNEITALKGELRDFRQRYESHQRVCFGCPHFEERIGKRAQSAPG